MSTPIRWLRRFPDSGNNFDLVVASPRELDSARMNDLLRSIEAEEYRKLTLSSRASREFRRWFSQPDTPLKSEAYILLSNWFLTNGGDRRSMLATRCEALWDALFPCRPADRLSSSAPGRNHLMISSEFERFWPRLLAIQGDGGHDDAGADTVSDGRARFGTGRVPEGSAGSSQLRAKIHKEGLECEVEGSPRAVADFLQLVSSWQASPEPEGKS
jgi:hypothetical protein